MYLECDHLGLFGVKYAEDLAGVGLRILNHLFPGKRGAGRILAAGITDHPGEISDQEQGMVPQILKVTHFVEQNSMTQMQVWRGGVKSGFDSERTIQSKLLRELLFEQELAATALDDFQLF